MQNSAFQLKRQDALICESRSHQLHFDCLLALHGTNEEDCLLLLPTQGPKLIAINRSLNLKGHV